MKECKMNERIRELWAQCVIKHTKTPMNWQDAADEFAESIVQECIMICEKVEKVDNVKIRAGATFCREDIKEHFFGVEE